MNKLHNIQIFCFGYVLLVELKVKHESDRNTGKSAFLECLKVDGKKYEFFDQHKILWSMVTHDCTLRKVKSASKTYKSAYIIKVFLCLITRAY